MADLYRFMRKILEKYNWDVRFGKEMLKAYHEIKPVSKEEWKNLKIRFSYPEKYWKLANYYYTHRKTWISVKNTEKTAKSDTTAGGVETILCFLFLLKRCII